MSGEWRTEYRVRCLSNPNHLPTVLPRLKAAQDLAATYSGACGPHVIEQRTVAIGAWGAPTPNDHERTS